MKPPLITAIAFCYCIFFTETCMSAATRAAATPNFAKSFFMPWTATKTHDNTINILTTALAGLANACGWAQPLQTRAEYLDATKNKAQRSWVLFFNTIWWVKKGIACHEIYRVGSRFHRQSSNPNRNSIEYVVSLLKILSALGDRVAEPEHLERVSRATFGETSIWRAVQNE